MQPSDDQVSVTWLRLEAREHGALEEVPLGKLTGAIASTRLSLGVTRMTARAAAAAADKGLPRGASVELALLCSVLTTSQSASTD